MRAILDPRNSGVSDDVFGCLSAAYRRAILRILRDRQGAVTEERLASELAAVEATGESGHLRVSLYHTHLPKLDAAELIEWDRDAGIVRPVDRPILDDPLVQRLLEMVDPMFDEVIDCFASEQRRAVLSVLESRDGTVEVHELARAVADRLRDVDDVDRLEVRLAHAHLPKLSTADLVTYVADRGIVDSAGTHEQLAPFYRRYGANATGLDSVDEADDA